MASYQNFYETLAEAEMRLTNTVVLYDDEPYYVLAVTNHKNDGIFRVYLDWLGNDNGPVHRKDGNIPTLNYGQGHPNTGPAMDAYIDPKPEGYGVIRKMANSPSFNKFRPFPLGMCNVEGSCWYAERRPTRHAQQGLTSDMIQQSRVGTVSSGLSRSRGVTIYDRSFYDMVKGNYPTPDECLKNLLDPSITNTAVGFHRLFALVRGPMDLLFLVYKEDVVGFLPNYDFSLLKMGKKTGHLREMVEVLGIFNDIKS